MNLAEAFLAKGINLGRAEQHEEAIAAYDALLSMFIGDDEPENQLSIAQAHFNKATIFGELGYFEDELANYNILISSFKRDKTLALQQQVAQSSFNKAITLLQLERNEDALTAFSQLNTLFQESNDVEIQTVLVQALINQAILLVQFEKNNEALVIADKLISAFKDSEIEAIQALLVEFIPTIIEFSLMSGTKNQTLNRIDEVNLILDNPLFIASNSVLHAITKAIISFYSFTLQACTIDDVLTTIAKLPGDIDFECSFEDLAGYLSTFTGDMAKQIALFVAYFEQHHSIDQLTAALAEEQSS